MARNQETYKAKFLAALRDMPIVEIACTKAGLPRSTFYRWRNEDIGFADEVEAALADGDGRINDLAESQLITLIKGGDLRAIMFRLNNKHNGYSFPRVVFKNAPPIMKPIHLLSTKVDHRGKPRKAKSRNSHV